MRIAPLEEIIWQKAYIMERECFDGADIVGTLLSRRHFISDVESNGLLDARLAGRSPMTLKQIKEWTQAGVKEEDPASLHRSQIFRPARNASAAADAGGDLWAMQALTEELFGFAERFLCFF